MKAIRCAALLALLLAALMLAAGATAMPAPQEGVVQIGGEPQPVQEQTPTELPEGMDMEYTGMLDPATGLKPVDSGADTSAQAKSEKNLVELSETCFYDRSARRYVNFFPNSLTEYYFTSIPQNMVMNQMVTIEVPSNLNWTLYRDGDQVAATALDDISQIGSYSLEVASSSGLANSIFRFEIVSGPTNHFPRYTAPSGFRISSVSLNSESVGVNSENTLELTEDGVYNIDIFSDAIGWGYQVRIESDQTPPVLALASVVEGEAASEISLEDAEGGAVLDIKLDGAPYKNSFGRVLTQVGHYDVRITDKAGNFTEYSFNLKLYFTVSSVTAVLLLVGAVAAIFIYSRYVRKHVRIR